MSKKNEFSVKSYESLDALLEEMEERLNNRKWWQKTWDYLRYVIWGRTEDLYYGIKNYLKNICMFSRQLWYFRVYEIQSTMAMFEFCLGKLSEHLEYHGIEEDNSRLKKVAAINELRQIVDDLCVKENSYELALEELHPGYLKKDIKEQTKIYKETPFDKADKICQRIKSTKIKRAYEIIKGQDPELTMKLRKLNKGKNYGDEGYVDYWDLFDGTGLMGWWD